MWPTRNYFMSGDGIDMVVSTLEMRGHVSVLEPADVMETLRTVGSADAVILDPWYNRGVGGTIPKYDEWLGRVVKESFTVAPHVFVWGFPDVVCRVLERLPEGTELAAWLTWYYKNCPSIVRGWRSAQYACLHLSKSGARVYPEHFMNEEQIVRYNAGKMRYIPGPPSVMEAPLNIGFVGKNEQTGHPAQKPVAVIEPLVKMSTKVGGLVVDPMCGAGTTGVACMNTGRNAVLCDESSEYIQMTKNRIGIG